MNYRLSALGLCILAVVGGFSASQTLFGDPSAKGQVTGPTISAVLNSATNVLETEPEHAVSPGSGISVFGEGFASHLPSPSTVPLSSLQIPLDTRLGDLSVTIDGILMPIFGIFRGEDFGTGFDQINGQLPWEVLATSKPTAMMQITSNGVASPLREISVAEASPGIYTWGFGPGPAIVTNFVPEDPGRSEFAQVPGTFCTSFSLPPEACVPTDPSDMPIVNEKPAEIGGVITIWGNGLGPLNGMVPTGDIPEPGAPLLFATKTVRVFIGGVEAQVLASILQPQFVSLNQINAFVPEGVTPGEKVPIIIEVECDPQTILRSRADATIAVAAATS